MKTQLKKKVPVKLDDLRFDQVCRKWPAKLNQIEERDGFLSRNEFYKAIRLYKKTVHDNISDFEKKLSEDEILLLSPILQEIKEIINE